MNKKTLLTKESILALAKDRSDYDVLQSNLPDSGTKEEIVLQLEGRARQLRRAGILRAFSYFGNDGLKSLCTLLSEGVFSETQIIPLLGRFDASQSALGILESTLPSFSSTRLTSVIIRMAADVLPNDAAVRTLQKYLSSSYQELRFAVVREITHRLRSDEKITRSVASEFFERHIATNACPSDQPTDLACLLIDGYSAYRDGRYLHQVIGAVQTTTAAYEVRCYAAGAYLDFFSIHGSGALVQLRLGHFIVAYLCKSFQKLSYDLQAEVVLMIFRHGLERYGDFPRIIASAEGSLNARLTHALEDARNEQGMLLTNDPLMEMR